MTNSFNISVVIPSYNRGQVLLDTITYLRELSNDIQIIVVDQTEQHVDHIADQLSTWHSDNTIELIKLDKPSVVIAMNTGLSAANKDYVLFVDDDIKPFPNLLSEYQSLISNAHFGIVAGRVVQPWDDEQGVNNNSTENFSFNGLQNCDAQYFIGCNVLINKHIALKLGGFDQNFVGTAHDYEREFSDRVLNAGQDVVYCADAAVHHLKEESGGIRTYGHFLKTMKPHHAVGAYYYILRSKRINNKLLRIVHRVRQRVITRTHLKQPWWIPLTLVGDILGIVWASYLWSSGPSLIKQEQHHKQN